MELTIQQYRIEIPESGVWTSTGIGCKSDMSSFGLSIRGNFPCSFGVDVSGVQSWWSIRALFGQNSLSLFDCELFERPMTVAWHCAIHAWTTCGHPRRKHGAIEVGSYSDSRFVRVPWNSIPDMDVTRVILDKGR